MLYLVQSSDRQRPVHARRRTKRGSSIHLHRRALLRRMGVAAEPNRPAAVMDALTLALLRARFPNRRVTVR